jgi:hypothetical protein
MARKPFTAPPAPPEATNPAQPDPNTDTSQTQDLGGGGEGDGSSEETTQEVLDANENPSSALPEDDLVAVISVGQPGTAFGTVVYVRKVFLEEMLAKGQVMLPDTDESDET